MRVLVPWHDRLTTKKKKKDLDLQFILNNYSYLESTELSKIFAKQGLKIPIRNDGNYPHVISIHPFLIFNSVRARKTD